MQSGCQGFPLEEVERKWKHTGQTLCFLFEFSLLARRGICLSSLKVHIFFFFSSYLLLNLLHSVFCPFQPTELAFSKTIMTSSVVNTWETLHSLSYLTQEHWEKLHIYFFLNHFPLSSWWCFYFFAFFLVSFLFSFSSSGSSLNLGILYNSFLGPFLTFSTFIVSMQLRTMIPKPLSPALILFMPPLKRTCSRRIHSWLLLEPKRRQVLPLLGNGITAGEQYK